MSDLSLLRHFIATLRYRGSKAILDAPEHYADYEAGFGVRSPIDILSHMSDVIRYAQSVICSDVQPAKKRGTWSDEVSFFLAELDRLDRLIQECGLPNDGGRIAEQLLQGPLADAMTHVGQLAMLRRMAGDAIPKENFFRAPISADNPGPPND
ncbi:hypothetical protein ACFPPD_26745 [Cohnella suwonensis]|uniref:DinB-like domain-containing protein n=1 Tax=Cohnella suwonensis TaxID=696072 RepID=A0ABW0M2B5_9BACL